MDYIKISWEEKRLIEHGEAIEMVRDLNEGEK